MLATCPRFDNPVKVAIAAVAVVILVRMSQSLVDVTYSVAVHVHLGLCSPAASDFVEITDLLMSVWVKFRV